MDLFVSSDVELGDERLGRVALDQVAHALRRPGRDNRTFAAGQHCLR